MRRMLLAAGATVALTMGLLPGAATAAVTSLSCTTRTAYPHGWSGSGDDYSDLWENVQQSPESEVSASSLWLCQPFNFQTDVQELVFTTSFQVISSLGGSVQTARGCGEFTVYDASFNYITAGGVTNLIDNGGGSFTCDWHVHRSLLVSGRTYFIEIPHQWARYNWESGPSGASYQFRIILSVHAEVTDHTASQYYNVPVCFHTIPEFACSFLGLDPLPH